MINLGYGLFAGFIATMVISAVVLVQLRLGILGEVNIIYLQADFFNKFGHYPAIMETGWISHFLIGTFFYGGMFGLFNPYIPGRTALGMATILMLVGWLLSMLTFMPLVGAGLFGLKLGFAAPIYMLVLHLIFGVALGYSYAHLYHRRITAKISESKCAPPPPDH